MAHTAIKITVNSFLCPVLRSTAGREEEPCILV